ncbi:HAD-IIB family hydrolase [Nitrospira sp. Nam74]
MSQASSLIMVISDLDGTLLDSSTYSHAAAIPALQGLKKNGACLVLASSKTRSELEPIRSRLGHGGPFIVENGGALFVPTGLFRFSLDGALSQKGYEVIQFGTPYAVLRRVLKDIGRVLGTEIKGFGDMPIEEVAELTGLTDHEAALAKQREYDEPFVLANDTLFELVYGEAAKRGLTCTKGGRFYHLLGRSNKGTACRFLIEYYRRHVEISSVRVRTIGIGDSANDLPLLAAVDQPILVQRPDGSYDSTVQLPHLIYAPGIGPTGWNTAILNVLGDH